MGPAYEPRHGRHRPTTGLGLCIVIAGCFSGGGAENEGTPLDGGISMAGDADASLRPAATDGGTSTAVACVSDRMCVDLGKLCDLERSLCVDCVRDVDCDASDRCDRGSCRPRVACTNSLDCVDAEDARAGSTRLRICHDILGECVECEHDADCDATERCLGRVCERPEAAAPTPDAGATDAGTPDGGVGADAGPTVPTKPPAGDCSDPPAVLLLIDSSGSMTDPYGDSADSRWDGVKAALFGGGGTDGALAPYESRIALSMLLYGGQVATITDPIVCSITPQICAPGECPKLVGAETPTLTTAATLASEFPDAPLEGNTPTHAALTEALAQLDAVPTSRRRAIVLLTDGAPNWCDTMDMSDAPAAVVALASTVAAAGVELHVVGVDATEAGFAMHLTDVATAADTAPAALPADADALRAQLDALLERLDCGP